LVAARSAGDLHTAFDLRFRIDLTRLARGDDVRQRPESELAADARALGGVRLAKWQVLYSAAQWHEQGSDLAAVTDVVADVALSGDADAAQLCCLVLEHAELTGCLISIRRGPSLLIWMRKRPHGLSRFARPPPL
jgi:hypothetical protein